MSGQVGYKKKIDSVTKKFSDKDNFKHLYNDLRNKYNVLVGNYNSLIEEYNTLVDNSNHNVDILKEELTKKISSYESELKKLNALLTKNSVDYELELSSKEEQIILLMEQLDDKTKELYDFKKVHKTEIKDLKQSFAHKINELKKDDLKTKTKKKEIECEEGNFF